VGSLVVLVVDTSGSMGANRRIAAGERSRTRVADRRLSATQPGGGRGLPREGAEIVLRPTGSIEIARARLTELATGGTTPLAAGIDSALTVARAARSDDLEPLLVLITDGRATVGGDDPVAAAHAAPDGLPAHAYRPWSSTLSTTPLASVSPPTWRAS